VAAEDAVVMKLAVYCRRRRRRRRWRLLITVTTSLLYADRDELTRAPGLVSVCTFLAVPRPAAFRSFTEEPGRQRGRHERHHRENTDPAARRRARPRQDIDSSSVGLRLRRHHDHRSYTAAAASLHRRRTSPFIKDVRYTTDRLVVTADLRTDGRKDGRTAAFLSG